MLLKIIINLRKLSALLELQNEGENELLPGRGKS